MVVVHEKCVRYTSIIDIGEDSMSRFDKEFRNVFTAIDRAQNCVSCGKNGATIRCSNHPCKNCYHFMCAEILGWNFGKQGLTFRCLDNWDGACSSAIPSNADDMNNSVQHGLFSAGPCDRNLDAPRILSMGASRTPTKTDVVIVVDDSEDDSEVVQEADITDRTKETATLPANVPLALTSSSSKLEDNRRGIVMLGRLSRKTVHERWNIDLYATCAKGSASRVLTVASSASDPFDQLEEGDIIRAINGIIVGSPELDSLQKVFAFLSCEIEVMMEVRRVPRPGTQWS
jgi:hypothetical protein